MLNHVPAPISVHRDRRMALSESAWQRGFSCEDLAILIVCRGPVRKEAIDVFREMGIRRLGILLSEKDSIVYPHALAPELRGLTPDQVHRVPDYTGATKTERASRMNEIVHIAKTHGYNAIFAGYGFMAEDAEFVATIEGAGLVFVGPCARTQRAAGQKDEAKRTALGIDVSVTPGVDDLARRTLKAKWPGREALLEGARQAGLDPSEWPKDFDAAVDRAISASHEAGVDLFTLDELSLQCAREVVSLLEAHPSRRIRIKAVGSGGGKGQRIVPAPAQDDGAGREAAGERARELLLEVLSEVKATGPGDNKNVLLELNVETTRHHEIQLLGNGSWCVSLGGRDCSVQMHEQKLLEISITQEGLKDEIALAQDAGRESQAQALSADLETLQRMEAEAERFGEAVGLDSASTFECIVDGTQHYFMEMNTRIQVEHRVSELCYALRFVNPQDPTDHFDVESLVEAMALVAWHKDRIPKPTRVPRFKAAVEARLNATDASLAPHPGGEIIRWSDPLPYEVRDDQGISIKNPDTGQFMRYRLAGAYDSNIALLVTAAESRRDVLEQLAEIVRVTKLRGLDLETNLEFHYGLSNWMLSQAPWAKVSTAFARPYLTLVGELSQAAREIDLDHLEKKIFERIIKQMEGVADSDGAELFEALRKASNAKRTLLRRPLHALLHKPHVLFGWLCRHRDCFGFEEGELAWKKNPVDVLADVYEHLNWDMRPELPAAHCIWAHDHELLSTAQSFYRGLERRLETTDWTRLSARLADPQPPAGLDPALWKRCLEAHWGHQLALEALNVLPGLAREAGVFELRVGDDLEVHIPERLRDPVHHERMRRVLSPPPATQADTIVAVSGGMFYAREAPDRSPLIQKGEHFEKGQPLYVIEVMKMFNKVPAPFSGTVDQVLIDGADGTVVTKGQPLFRVTPDERVVQEDPKEVAARRRAFTERVMGWA